MAKPYKSRIDKSRHYRTLRIIRRLKRITNKWPNPILRGRSAKYFTVDHVDFSTVDDVTRITNILLSVGKDQIDQSTPMNFYYKSRRQPK